MKPWEKYSFNAAALVLTVSGVAYFWMKYMMTTEDPFAVVNHPWEGAMLQLHILAAPAFLVLFGIVFRSHVARKIGQPLPNRKSGLLSLGSVAVMTISGYALQVVTSAAATQIWLVAHLASGGVFALAYPVHLVISASIWARERRSRRHAAAA